ncbi:hypothetical protein H5392_03515 [Tessaracoccus sp. MC1865]|uniref:hypothetical protein n=1 Tax=Tessaracoccus sp. MC1865 TaxID=2760310 RepID=UPI001600AE0E|nr:hypothetical protein [Tessaracoccus sp. MC1865]MBB1482927.1 hypothetical protein [Tessaracoccus sp. MC1865]QTO37634.1 hypothetical protein J7D54_00570 [Tessaracoccus sp. MC1865]
MSATTGNQDPVQQDGADATAPWRSLVIGAAALLLALLPHLAMAVREAFRGASAGGQFRLALNLFSYYNSVSAVVMAAAFTALGLRIWRAKRGPVAAGPAAFVATVGMALLVVVSFVDLSGNALSPSPPAMLVMTMAVVAAYSGYAVLAYWLLMRGPIAFTVGLGLLYLPTVYWLTGLMSAVVGQTGSAAIVYVPYVVAAGLGLALGRLGWDTPRRILAWLAVLLIVTVGVAGHVALDAALTMGGFEQTWATFWIVLQGSLISAGIALIVGVLVRLIDTRRGAKSAASAA